MSSTSNQTKFKDPSKPKRAMSMYIAFLNYSTFEGISLKERRVLWKQYKACLEIKFDDALLLQEELIKTITGDKERYEREMVEYIPLTTKDEVVAWRKQQRELKKRVKKESDSKRIVELEKELNQQKDTVADLQQQLSEMKAKYEPEPEPEPEPTVTGLEIEANTLACVLRHCVLKGRDIVQALVCKQFRDTLKESASEWVHPKFYLQSSLHIVRYCVSACIDTRTNKSGMICLDTHECADWGVCLECRDKYIIGVYMSSEYDKIMSLKLFKSHIWSYYSTPTVKRCLSSKRMIYGYGHEQGKNPYSNSLDPVMGGSYVKPESEKRQFPDPEYEQVTNDKKQSKIDQRKEDIMYELFDGPLSTDDENGFGE